MLKCTIASAAIFFVKPGAAQVLAVATGKVNNETFVASFRDEYMF